jgi:hypothetical protein
LKEITVLDQDRPIEAHLLLEVSISFISASGGRRRRAGSVFRKRRKNEIIETTRQTLQETVSKVEATSRSAIEASREAISRAEETSRSTKETAEAMISAAQKASEEAMKVSQEELDQAISEIRKDYPGEGFGEKLDVRGTTLDEWKVRLEEKLLAEKVIRSTSHFDWKKDEKEALLNTARGILPGNLLNIYLHNKINNYRRLI